jgi:transcriptional regulator with XRE-family HTH domain
VTHHPKLPDLEGLLDKEGRDEFLSSAVRLGISIQTQVLRGDRSQKEFATQTGKTQTQISRLENAKSGGVSLQTLIEIASALNIGLSVRFVDYETMLDEINDMSDEALQVRTIFQSVEAARLTDFKLIRFDGSPRPPIDNNNHQRVWPSTTDGRKMAVA